MSKPLSYLRESRKGTRLSTGRKTGELKSLQLHAEIILATAHLHKIGIVHGSLHTRNVMLEQVKAEEWHIKVIDFGVGRTVDLRKLNPEAAKLQKVM